MARFIYVATIFKQGSMVERIPVFAFGVGGPEASLHGWDSAEVQNASDFTRIQDRVAGARELTMVVPVPIAIQFLGIQAHIERLKIFASKPSEPLGVQFSLDFDGLNVVGKKHIPKGTFKMEGSQFQSVPAWGGQVNMAMFTPEAVTLFVPGS